jgi:hypothetical protein
MAFTNLWGPVFSRIERVGGQPTTMAMAMAKSSRRGVCGSMRPNVGAPTSSFDVDLNVLRDSVGVLLTDRGGD